ncbi:MAG: hypothetical protein K9J42_04925 [Sulfuritalea sp.]|nr:hypothetical protein [Sulfuritalea sp.]
MPRLLPRYIQLVALLLAGGVAFLAIWIPLSEPWLGVRFTVLQGMPHVLAKSSATEHALPREVAAIAESKTGREAIPLRAETFIDTPGYFQRFSDYNRFFESQARLTALRASPAVELELADGTRMPLEWRQRDLSTLGFTFWFQFVCALLAFSVAASVLAYRPGDTPAHMYFILGIGCLLIGMTAAVMRARMLSIGAETFRLVHIANHVGIFMGCVGLVGFLGTYPRRLLSGRSLIAICAIYGTLLLGDILQWVESINLAFRLPLLATALPGIALLVWQWRKSRSRLLDRAALKWILFSFGISIVLIFANVLRTALGAETFLPSGYNTALTLLIFIGMAVGIRRSALFNLEPWWIDAWIWLASGFAVVVVDLLLLSVLEIGEASALAASLLLCGWLYFPLRQSILTRVYGRRRSLTDVLPEIVEMLFAGPAIDRDFEARWHELLNRVFEPQAINFWTETKPGETATVLDDGLRLGIPAIGDGAVDSALVLEYAGAGSRLFTSQDARLAQSIWTIVQRGVSVRADYADGVNAERERIAHDLHDDIGARLLTLIHRAQSPQDADIARSAMQDMRTLLSALNERPRQLEDALGDWRAEAESRCEAADLQLDWRQDFATATFELSSRQGVNLEKMLREILSNAIRHAGATRIGVSVSLAARRLSIVVEDNGVGLSVDRWQRGRGTLGMERRAQDIDAQLQRRTRAGGGTRIEISVELQETS